MKNFIIDISVLLIHTGTNDFILRPASHKLVNYLLAKGNVHLYSYNTLTTDLFRLKHTFQFCKFNDQGLTLPEYIKINSINDKDMLIIHDSKQHYYIDQVKNVKILPEYFLKRDSELNILNDYLSYKVNKRNLLSDVDFNDWIFRNGLILSNR